GDDLARVVGLRADDQRGALALGGRRRIALAERVGARAAGEQHGGGAHCGDGESGAAHARLATWGDVHAAILSRAPECARCWRPFWGSARRAAADWTSWKHSSTMSASSATRMDAPSIMSYCWVL